LEKDVLPYLQQKHIKPPACFISYAWGDPYHEFWVKRFSEMLTKAGVHIILDRSDVKRGNILSEFIKRIEEADHVIVVGTKLYLEKFNRRAVNLKNKEHVVRVEAQLIEYLVGYSTEMGDKVIPIILEGTPEESLPFMLRHKLSSEFSKNDYFEEMLRLVRDLYGIDGRDKPFQEFTEKLRKYTLIITKNITEKEKKEFEEKRIKEIEELDNKILNDINSFKEKAL